MTRRVTLREVADHAGVSVTTVSNVIREWPHISQETRQKVEVSIEALGYVPHPIAQGLRTGQTYVIGFIVPDIANPHFAAMVGTIEDVARTNGYNILIFNTNDDEAIESECIQQAVKRWVDGLLIVQASQATKTTETLKSINVPVVAIDRIPPDFEGVYARSDNHQAAHLVMEHLFNQGHTRIAHLAGPQGAIPARDRLHSYQEFIATHQLAYERITYTENTWGTDDGYRMMFDIFEDDIQPTAIFASNDTMAIGALHAMYERGLRVPDDMSLVGIDDIAICQHLTPPLTSVRQPLMRMAHASINKLLQLMDNNNDVIPESEIFAAEFIVRESTAPPKQS